VLVSRRLPLAAAVALLLSASFAWAQPSMWMATTRFGSVFETSEQKSMYVEVEWPVDGVQTAADLVVEVDDAYGERVLDDTVQVLLSPGQTTGRVVTLGPTKNGLLSARAIVRSTAGDELARTHTTIAVVPPLPEQDTMRSAIGYFFDPDNRSELPYRNEIAAQVAALGIRWIKLHYRWNDRRLERPDTDDPAWLNTSAFEQWAEAFHAHGVRVLGQVSRVARWASSQPERDGRNHFGRGPIYALVAPKNVEDWSLMVRTLMERLRGRVDGWEIGNEPEGTIYWMGSVEEFSAIVIASAQALHEVDPDLPLVVNMVNTWDKLWAREFLRHAGPVLDVFGFHYATRETVKWIKNELLAPHDITPAIWDTEAFGNTQALGKDRMFSNWLESRAGGTSRLFHFVYHLPFYPTPESEQAWIARFGQFPVNADYSPRLHAVGIRTLSDFVGAKNYVSDRCVANKVWGYVFEEDGNGVLVLSRSDTSAWALDETVVARFKLPARTRAITVTDIMGNRRTIAAKGKSKQIDVPLTGSLAFVEGIPVQRMSRLSFRGYVDAEGKLAKRRKRGEQYCSLAQLGLPTR